MNAYTSSASLVIHPEDPDWHPDELEQFAEFLRQQGFIADRLKSNEPSYLVGDNFLEQIAFLGCSPNINLTPQDNPEKFCFIRLLCSEIITALTSKHTHAPHCPHCKQPEKHWLDRVTPTSLECSSCGKSSPSWRYNWRKSAGFGRFFIEVTEIYPREAIPQATFLSALEHYHNTRWSYFYLYS